MTRHVSVTGELVWEIRAQRRAGVAISAIARDLSGRGLGVFEVSEHLEQAFCLRPGGADRLYACREEGSAALDARAVDLILGPTIDDAGPRWEADVYFPDVMRRRDRSTFLDFAARTRCAVFVRGASPLSARYLNRHGYRVRPLGLVGFPRITAPHAGLLALDPADPRLRAALASPFGPPNYEALCADVRSRGYSVSDAEEGFLLTDPDGAAFHEDYELHGVYDVSSGQNAWTGEAGERMRRELNQGLGADLIQHGPHDLWEHRLDERRAWPACGARPPVIAYLPDGRMLNLLGVSRMRALYRQIHVAWDSVYPPAPDDRAEAGTE